MMNNEMIVNYFGQNIIMNFINEENDCAVNKAISRGRIWEPRIVKIYSELINKESIIIDVGAHLGTHTIPFSIIGKQVYSFEPQKRIFNLLEKTIKDNNISNVTLFNKVVSTTNNEEVDFINTETGRASIWSYRPYLNGYHSREKTIMIDSLNLDKLDFLKIDAEKTEWLVLKGATETILKCKPLILLETFKNKTNLNKLSCFCGIYNYDSQYIACDNYLLTPKI